MTENQLFSMSTELFDTSSNSSNPLKYDLYSLGLSTSVGSSASALFATFTNTSSADGVGVGCAAGSNSTNALCSNQQNSSGSSNVMLTNAITIPRSNNPNQRHNYFLNEAQTQHHPSSSPFLSHLLQHQQLQQQQNLQQQQLNAMMSSTSSNSLQSGQQQQQQQQQHQQQQMQQSPVLLSTTNLSDYSDYALDALDSSLSPTLLQDVSLSAAVTQSLNSAHNSSTSITSPFYNQDPSSPNTNGSVGSGNGSNGSANNLAGSGSGSGSVGGGGASSAGSNSMASNSLSISSSTDITGVIKFFNSTANNEDSSSLLYDSNLAPNSMWSDIGCAISTKNEPFSIDDNYIGDVNTTEFGDFEGEIVSLEDIGNLEDFLPSSGSHDEGGGHSFHLLSPSMHAEPSTPSPGMGPPMELLQQQQQEQQQQHNMQQFSQLQNISSNTGGNNSTETNANSNVIQIQQQQRQQQQSSSSPYDIYHSTPNKQQQQMQQQHNNTFSPGSLPSHSPLQMNSITPPPPPHTNRSQYQVKSRNIQELLKKDFSISPDRNHNSASLLGHSIPGSHGLLMTHNNITLSPSSAGSSGFGSTNGANMSSGSFTHTTSISGGPVISFHATRKPFSEGNTISRLSSSAPTHLGPDIWMRREPRQHLLSTGSLAEAESFSSLSTGSVLSPEGHDYSQDDDEDNSTDYNSDHYDDLSSDNGSDNDDDSSTMHGRTNSMSSHHHPLSASKGKERFFWQYNVQAKGPKGKRLVFQSRLEDPHILNEVTDPVFSPNCSVRGIKVYKHSGKARKGDGNDLTPNPRKLNNIGKELDTLSRTINDMTPVSELPFNVRPKSRKEKNKLASRACRLKKKAQHEANKIKLFGLEIEHKRLLNAIADIKQNLALKYRRKNAGENVEDVDQQIERIYKHAIGGLAIAGSSTDFVNKVLENVKNGQPSGGLEELRNT